MVKFPYPKNVHPALVELVDQMQEQYEKVSLHCAAKPYFGYRSTEEQAALYAQGRQPLWDVNMLRSRVGMSPITETENQRTVTNARPGASEHNANPARAVDMVIVDLHNGVNYVWDAGLDLDTDGIAEYVELGRIGEQLGLTWGGAWKMKDWGHFELPAEDSVAMKAIYARLAPDPAKVLPEGHYDLTAEVNARRQRMGIPS